MIRLVSKILLRERGRPRDFAARRRPGRLLPLSRATERPGAYESRCFQPGMQ
jgi:hypothetical protein